MTNGQFRTLEDFRDVESINAFHELTAAGVMDPETMLACLRYKGRDNSRTPMQWTAGKNAGFTDGTPWIAVNENCREINAEEQLVREDSVFRFYQKLVAFRHSQPVVIDGRFQLLLPDDTQIFAYERITGGERLLAVCNLSGKPASFALPEAYLGCAPVLSVFPDLQIAPQMELRPWEAFALLRRG